MGLDLYKGETHFRYGSYSCVGDFRYTLLILKYLNFIDEDMREYLSSNKSELSSWAKVDFILTEFDKKEIPLNKEDRILSDFIGHEDSCGVTSHSDANVLVKIFGEILSTIDETGEKIENISRLYPGIDTTKDGLKRFIEFVEKADNRKQIIYA